MSEVSSNSRRKRRHLKLQAKTINKIVHEAELAKERSQTMHGVSEMCKLMGNFSIIFQELT
jgi:hypothetical protein